MVDTAHVRALVDEALEILEDEPERAQVLFEKVREEAGEVHPDVLHLHGMLTLVEGDVERALGFLLQAVDGGPSPRGYLDCAQLLLMATDEPDEAEHVLREVLTLVLNDDEREEALLLLAECRLSHEDEDPEEALELLDQLPKGAQTGLEANMLRARALLGLDQAEEAASLLRTCLAEHPDDPELQYQLGVTLRAAGDMVGSASAMQRVLELDTALSEHEPAEPADDGELLQVLETAIDELPGPLLERVATAALQVQSRATPEQVASGVDPRSTVVLIGKGAGERSRELATVVVMRDVVRDEAVTEQDLVDLLLEDLGEAVTAFFGGDVVVARA